jgi:hypothetical protein
MAKFLRNLHVSLRKETGSSLTFKVFHMMYIALNGMELIPYVELAFSYFHNTFQDVCNRPLKIKSGVRAERTLGLRRNLHKLLFFSFLVRSVNKYQLQSHPHLLRTVPN